MGEGIVTILLVRLAGWGPHDGEVIAIRGEEEERVMMMMRYHLGWSGHSFFNCYFIIFSFSFLLVV